MKMSRWSVTALWRAVQPTRVVFLRLVLLVDEVLEHFEVDGLVAVLSDVVVQVVELLGCQRDVTPEDLHHWLGYCC